MRITSKGQVTIPKRIRKKMGLHPSTEIEFIEEGNAVKIVKKGKKSNPWDEVYGLLRLKERTDDIIEKLRGR